MATIKPERRNGATVWAVYVDGDRLAEFGFMSAACLFCMIDYEVVA